MTAFSEYFLNSRADIVQLELLEITHPNFTKPYRIVRNAPAGVTVDLSPDRLAVDFIYYPVAVSQDGARDDLDSSIKVALGDVGEIVPDEMDAVNAAGAFLIKPTMTYWCFRSDQLDQPIYGPIDLEIVSIERKGGGATFEARAPTLNSTKTGERYTLERFPMLRGFL